MLEKIALIIDYIDAHYHENVENNTIESLTGLSSAHVRSEFKKIVGMPLDKYRRRRQLTLIINEIIDMGCSISKSNLLPWGSANSFRVTFKKEFGILPNEIIKDPNYVDWLQQKFDQNVYTAEEKVVNELISLYGTPSNAVEYLLSLPPYQVLTYINSMDDSLEEKYNLLIWSNHGNIPNGVYKQEMQKLTSYYDVKNEINTGNLLISYYVANRYLIKKIAESNEIYLSIVPCDLRTIWYKNVQVKKNRYSNRYRKPVDYIVEIPGEFKNGIVGISDMQHRILKEFIIKDNNANDFESFEELMKILKSNGYNPSDVNPNYENIERDDIVKEIHFLLMSGLLYINTTEY